MQITVMGHCWEDHYLYMQGQGRNAIRKEVVTPGGAWLLSEIMRQAGMSLSVNPLSAAGIREEYYDCLAPHGTSVTARHSLCYTGCVEGHTLLEPQAANLTVVLDEGFDSLRCPDGCEQVLWASRMRIPDSKTSAAFPDNTVLLLDADLLRQNGALISHQISWERTATDTVWQLNSNPLFRHLLSVREIIVTFAEEGCLVLDLSNTGNPKASLYLVSGAVEGTARFSHPGAHPTAWCMVTASAAIAAAQGNYPAVPAAFPAALETISKGAAFSQPDTGGYMAAAAHLLTAEYAMGCYHVPCLSGASQADEGYWRILDHFSSITTDRLAEQIVKHGLSSIVGVPRITFGKLTSIDRSEMESFMNIRNLIAEYVAGSESRPLSLAVFGTPGSGKSFGVVQIAENILPDRVKKIEFNVSQFSKRSDLTAALHKVRDVALGGKLPLVFFDEFDSDYEGKLGWLKSFLMPMQDGAFLEGEVEHPIGRCIFVFAGGTCASFDEFSLPLSYPEDNEERKLFRALKGPDFISRLRGTINVLGPNRKDSGDKSFLLRRALLLRSLCERKLKGCFSGTTLNIDDSIVTAMLLVPKYLHGARSMESIIDMSRTSGCCTWEPSSLPVHAQLSLHVDADAFTRLLLRDVLLGSYREQLAIRIHENYCKIQHEKKLTDSTITSLNWDQLPGQYKEANRAQADDIINKLGRFGYGFDAGDSFFDTVKEFPPDKLEEMAKIEHERWMGQKQAGGWTYAPGQKDDVKRTSPCLLDWDLLDHATQELDRDAVRNIIPLLEQIGLRVYRRD